MVPGQTGPDRAGGICGCAQVRRTRVIRSTKAAVEDPLESIMAAGEDGAHAQKHTRAQTAPSSTHSRTRHLKAHACRVGGNKNPKKRRVSVLFHLKAAFYGFVFSLVCFLNAFSCFLLFSLCHVRH